MLEGLRKAVGSWVAKIFIALLVFSFAIWGVGDMFRGAGERDVARVGSVNIPVETFRDLYQQRLQQLNRQFGRGFTPEQARMLGIDRELLGEVVSETVLDEKARALRLNISDETLIRRIHQNPLFQGPGGTFDAFRFDEILRASGFTEQRYIDSERRLLLRQQIGQSLGGDLTPPQVVTDAIHRFENEERSIELVTLDRTQAGEVPAPAESELAAYFESRKAAFRTPEYRRLTVVPLTPEILAAEIQVSEAELRKAFEERRDEFANPERREIEQIVFPNLEEAQAAAQRIAAGASFEEIMAERDLNAEDVSLGLVSEREILDPAVAGAAFALAEDTVSEPLEGRFGAVLVRVTRIDPGAETDFTAVAEELRKRIAAERAQREILEFYDRIEDERAGGSTLAEAATKVGLKPVTLEAVDRSGRALDGKRVENIPVFDQVLQGAFDTQVGVETDPIDVRGTEGFVWYEVQGITPPRDPTLDEVRDRVEARWRDEQIGKQLEERAEAIRSRLDGGEPLSAAAEGLPVETRDKLRRGGSADGLDRRLLAQVFETAKGRSGISAAADGVGRIVFRVVSVEVPPKSETDPQRVAQLSAGLQDDLLVQYVLRLQNEIGVHVNETALRTVTGDVGN